MHRVYSLGAGREGDRAVPGVASEDFSDETWCCGLRSPQGLLEQFSLAQTARIAITLSSLSCGLRSFSDHSS